MSISVKAGEDWSRLALRAGVSVAELKKANPGLSALTPGEQLAVPGRRDAFSTKPVQHDASAQAALRDLEKYAGPTISVRELERAIDVGTRDKDSQMAGNEYRDFASWTKAHSGQLSEGAAKVMAMYARKVNAAARRHQSGMSVADRAQLLAQMKSVPDKLTSGKSGTGGGTGATTPRSAKEWQQQALAHPDHIFKRQVRDPRWNNERTAPLYSGHCAITTLAMAVEAFGLEKKGLDRANHSKDQDTIDHVASLMPHKFEVQRNGGHTWLTKFPGQKATPGTFASQMAVAARKSGLQHSDRPNMSLAQLDRALRAGHMVCLAGTPGGRFQRAEGHSFGGGHSVLVMGRTADGHYLVCDPLSRKGPTRLTASQMASYHTGGYTSTEVWRSH